MNQSSLIERLQTHDKCLLYAINGLPEAGLGHVVPDDMLDFYTHFGGCEMFVDKDHSWKILPPHQVRPLRDVELLAVVEEFQGSSNGLFTDFYTIVGDMNGDYLAINLSTDHLGLVIDAFHDSIGASGNTPVIAKSFTELVEKLLENHGDYPYWLANPETIHRDWFAEDES